MLELEHGFRVVDVNTRLEPDRERRPRDGIGDPEQLEREMHQGGVVKAVVYPGPRDGSYLKANNAVARMTVGRQLIAFARVNGKQELGHGPGSTLRNFTSRRDDDHTSPGDVEHYAYDDRFSGFKLDPAADGFPDTEVLEELEAVSLPVLVRGSEAFPPSDVEEELLGYDFPVVLSHFGGYPLRRDLMDTAIDMLGSADNLYLDTSVVRFREQLERAIREHPDRVLFGSGAPHVHPNVAVMEILTLDVPEDAMKKVFSNNPGRVVEALAP